MHGPFDAATANLSPSCQYFSDFSASPRLVLSNHQTRFVAPGTVFVNPPISEKNNQLCVSVKSPLDDVAVCDLHSNINNYTSTT